MNSQMIDWKYLLIRALISIFGITLISLGVSLSQTLAMGLDPFTSINSGASNLLGFSLGNFQLGVNLGVLLIIFLLDRSILGLGTVFNMVLVGYQVEFFTAYLQDVFISSGFPLVIRLIMTVVAIMLTTLGVALYKDTDLGVSPYDAIAPVIADRTGWKYRNARLLQDVIVVIGAILVGGPIGVTTFITGFFAGPFIEFFSENITRPLVEQYSRRVVKA